MYVQSCILFSKAFQSIYKYIIMKSLDIVPSRWDPTLLPTLFSSEQSFVFDRLLCEGHYYIESCLSAAQLFFVLVVDADFSFVHVFSLRSSLSSFSFIMSIYWSKNNNKNNGGDIYRMKRKKGKKIYFLHLPLPPDNPPPPSVGKKVTNVWLFYLRVRWFRNLNTCIPVWQRRKTEISVSNTSLTLQGQLWKGLLYEGRNYPKSRRFSLAWLVCRVVSLFTPRTRTEKSREWLRKR